MTEKVKKQILAIRDTGLTNYGKRLHMVRKEIDSPKYE